MREQRLKKINTCLYCNRPTPVTWRRLRTTRNCNREKYQRACMRLWRRFNKEKSVELRKLDSLRLSFILISRRTVRKYSK